MLDTFKHIKTLEESGLPKKQAEAQMKILRNVIGGHLVTKETFEHHMDKIQKDFTMVHKEITHQFELNSAQQQQDLQTLKTELQKEILESINQSINGRKELLGNINKSMHNNINSLRTEFDTKLEKLKTDLKHDLTIRLGGLMIGVFTIGIGIIVLLVS